MTLLTPVRSGLAHHRDVLLTLSDSVDGVQYTQRPVPGVNLPRLLTRIRA